MGLKDLFVPDWKHSNPKIRIGAVKNLSDLRLLKEIFTSDKDVDVKKAALDKINDQKIFEDFYNELSDQHLKEIVKEKLIVRFLDKILDIGADEKNIDLELFNGLEEKELVKIFFESKNNKVKDITLSVIKDDKTLFNIVMDERSKDFGQIILDKMTSDHYIKRLSRESASKKMKKRALDRLKTILEQENKTIPELVKKDVENLLTKLKEYQGNGVTFGMKEKVSQIREEFSKIKVDSKISIVSIFEKQLLQAEEDIKVHEETVKELNSLMDRLKQVDITDHNVKKNIELLEEEYKKLGKSRLTNEEREKFENLFYDEITKTKARQLEKQKEIDDLKFSERMVRNALKEVENLGRNIEKNYRQNKNEIFLKVEQAKSDFYQYVTEDEKFNNIKDHFKKVLSTVEEKVADLKKRDLGQEELEKALTTIIEKVESALNLEEFREKQKIIFDLVSEWKEVGTDIPQIKEKFQKKFQSLVDLFYKEQRELRQNQDWQRWFNLKQKQDLVTQIEDLVEKDELIGMGNALMDARERWKGIGPIPKSEGDSLWEKFNEVCQKGFDKCYNKKKEIYTSLKEVLAPTIELTSDEDLSKINYQETWNRVKSVQQEWNDIGALPKKLESSLYEDFRKQVDSFLDKRKRFYELQDSIRTGNANLKKEIIKELEKNLKSKEDKGEIVNQVKELQRRWKEIGPVPKVMAQEINDTFFKLCRNFFGELHQEKEEIIKHKEEILKEVKELIEETLSEKNFKDLEPSFENFKTRLTDIGLLNNHEDEKLMKSFYQMTDKYNQERNEFLKGQNLEAKKLYLDKIELVKDFERIYFGDKSINLTSDDLLKIWNESKKLSNNKDQDFFQEQVDLLMKGINESISLSLDKNENMFKDKISVLMKMRTIVKIVFPDKGLKELNGIDMGLELEMALKLKNKILSESPKKTLLNAQNEFFNAMKEWWEIGLLSKESQKDLSFYYNELAYIIFNDEL